jgi:hypothetical protein
MGFKGFVFQIWRQCDIDIFEVKESDMAFWVRPNVNLPS